MISDGELIRLYGKYQSDRNLSTRTIYTRRLCLRVLSEANPGGFATVTRDDIERVLDEQKRKAREAQRSFGPRRRAWWLSCIQCFYRWAIRHGYLLDDPTLQIDRPKLRKTLPRPIQDADLDLALDNAEPMMRCWLLLGAEAGLRCQEIAGLGREDINESERLLRVVSG